MANPKPRALIVDDEPDIRELFSLTLDRMNIEPVLAATCADARNELSQRAPDLCLTDMRLPDGDGLDLVSWIQEYTPQVPVAVITAHGNVESAVEALKRGAFDFVSKPVDLAQLRNLVGAALRLEERAAEVSTPPSPRLMGESKGIQQVRDVISKVARSQAPVHISGESGTGKELAARLIHDSGARAHGPFVPVNCGAIPSELMESEFFGHKKGAFTGAHADKEGLFQAADGGTLFLDEVAELPLTMQVKLLRVIQERAVRPVGAAREIPVDVRILSATHHNLDRLVAESLFREDLYYRINVIELHIPALRDRRDDILPLAEHILDRIAANTGMQRAKLSREAAAFLGQYDFPGNIRELENMLERALTLCSDNQIAASDLTPRDRQPSVSRQPSDLDSQLAEVERESIRKALEATHWNRTAAAKQLGLTLRQLRYKIQKLGLEA